MERLLGPLASEPDAAASWLVIGWAAVSLAAAVSAVGNLPLPWPAVCLCLVGLGGYVIPGARVPLGWLLLAWLILAPLVFIASTIPPAMIDEFTQWLPNTRFLVERGTFPDATTPNVLSQNPHYPPAIPLLG